MIYSTNARNIAELRTEFVNDIRRRIDNLTAQQKVFGRGAAGKARFDGRINELNDMLHFWTEIELTHDKKGSTA